MAALDPSKMNPMEKLKYLGLVNKICQELDNHIGVSDKTLAEFIIALATEHKELPAFRAALEENGAEFPAPFASQLLNLVEKMMPKPKAAPAASAGGSSAGGGSGEKFSGLAVPNTSDERRKQLERDALGGDAVVNPEAEQLKRGATGGKAAKAPPPPPGRGGSKPGHVLPEDRPPDDTPVPGRVYPGKVSNVLDFGCFVQLENVRGRAEGLVHVSLIGGPVGGKAHDLVKRNAKCYVKVLAVTGQKLTLSMKDADQKDGTDLTPHMRLPGQKEAPTPEQRGGSGSGGSSASNPMRPVGEGGAPGKRKLDSEESNEPQRVVKRLTSPEKFEAQQLIASGVLDVRDYPQFDEEHGMMAQATEETEEELEIELNESEPLFLRGQTKLSVAMSPIKIVKNPDGSLQRAAMTQSALAKERRELKETQQRAVMDSIPKDLNRPWEDPLPEPGERHIAQELRGLGYTQEAQPEWKTQTMGKAVSFGFPSRNKSIQEQRNSLRVYVPRTFPFPPFPPPSSFHPSLLPPPSFPLP